jgi:hypothetical protein
LPAQDPPTPATFENWINFAAHRTTIWGVDPGVTDIFVAADGTNEDRHRYRNLSSKEYYHLCGFNKATEKRRRWKIEAGEQWRQLFDDMPSLKTANFDQLLDALRYRLDNFAAIVEPFDRQFRYRRLAFSSYRNRQRGIHEICRRFTFGSKKYGQPPSPRHQHVADNAARPHGFWTPASPIDRPYEDEFQHYIIAFGNGCFGNMRGKRPSAVKKIFQHLCYLSRQHNRQISVLKIDEYLTSQVCAFCDQRRLKNLRERHVAGSPGPKIHALLRCENCRKVWNRDQMAAKNIKHIFEYMASHNNQRPPNFERPSTTTPNVEDRG